MADSIVDLGAAAVDYVGDKISDAFDYITGAPKARASDTYIVKKSRKSQTLYSGKDPRGETFAEFFGFSGFEDGGVVELGAASPEEIDEFLEFVRRNMPSYKEGEMKEYRDFPMLGMQEIDPNAKVMIDGKRQDPPRDIIDYAGQGIGQEDFFKDFADPLEIKRKGPTSFDDGGEVGIMSALLDPRIDLPSSEQQNVVRASGREGSEGAAMFYPEGSPTFEQVLETRYGYPDNVERGDFDTTTEIMRAERPRADMPTYQELEDARAHALQTALLAKELGPRTAQQLGGLSEFTDKLMGATPEDIIMDKRNNAFGAKLLKQAGVNATSQQIAQMVDDEVFKQLDVILGREPGKRRFKSPKTGIDVYFPRDRQGFFNVNKYD
jgi:hypothetical protein